MAYKFIFVQDDNGQLVEVIRQGERGAPTTSSAGTNPFVRIDRPGAPSGGGVDLRFTQQMAGEVFTFFLAKESIDRSQRMTEEQKNAARELLQSSLPGDAFYFVVDNPLGRVAGDQPGKLKRLLITFVDP